MILWMRAFVLTVIVEGAVAHPLLGRAHPSMRRLVAVLIANTFSHPIAWFLVPITGAHGLVLLLLIELWALASEAAVYRLSLPNTPWSRALAVSAIANGASLGTGAILRANTDYLG